ncbi:MAG: alpha/beta hydrolase [Dehalococcoidia bacterium]
MPDHEPFDLDAIAHGQGRFNARPQQHLTEPVLSGLHSLGLGAERDGVRYVPAGYDPAYPAPLVLMLHGATGNGQRTVASLMQLADEFGLILLAPDSRLRTWDVLTGGFGPDIAFIDAALTETFARYVIDSTRIAAEGFSDGASYALSIGIANGDLFTHILAFSPGFIAPPGQEGSPRIFVSHGRQDQVLPINHCSRLFVPQLRRAGYDVTYEEFDGPHRTPPEIAREGVEWFTDT